MKVLHYISDLDASSGGTTAYMQLLAEELGQIAELCVVSHRSPLPVELKNATVQYVSPSLLGGMKREWTHVLSAFRPDVVHINGCWMPQCVWAQRWAQRAGHKVVLTPHGSLEPWIMKRHYWTRKLPALLLYQRKAIAQADCLHATSPSERDNLLQLGYNPRVELIPNGVEVEKIRLKTSWERRKRILFLSRIHVKKGIELLVAAVARLKDRLEGYEVWVAGDGDAAYLERLRQLAVRRGVGGLFRFPGGVYGDKKWRLLRESDVFVLPTYSENFGIVVAEALACGTPVVTTQGTPWHELETQGCGWWTEPCAEAIAQALDSFLRLSPAEIETMGRNGRRLVEVEYSATKMAASMLVLYERMR